MTALDHHIAELNVALQKIIKWPLKKERDETLTELIIYLADILDTKRTSPPKE